jgi:tetratricopeptide (TPR) repeat protein
VIWHPICACLLVAGALGVLSGQTPPSAAVRDHFERAQAALAAGQYDVAAGEFEAILKLDPARAEALANLGTVYYAQSKYAEAAQAFRKALRLKPTLKGAEAFLGMSEARLGNIKEALPLLEKGFRNPLSDQWKLESGLLLAGAYQREGESSRVQEVIATLERDFPKNPEVLYLAYRIHSAMGARAVANLVKAAPESARLRQITAELLEIEGDFAGAIVQYRKALEIEPKLPGAHRALGVALMNNVNDTSSRLEAQREFEQELAANPGDTLSEYQLGELMWLANRPAAALGHLQRAVELQPHFPDALIALGKVLVSTGKLEEAVPLLEKAVALDPSSEVARYRLAQAFQKAGNRERAERELAEFRRLRSALESLGGIYRQVQENRITNQRVE